MRNKAMERKLQSGACIDLRDCATPQSGIYLIPDVCWEVWKDGTDFCDSWTEEWIRSIGRHKKTGEIVASTTAQFYQNPSYECLWLR